MLKHPTNRKERIEADKLLAINVKKKTRASRIKHKLSKEHLQEKEQEDELREYTRS